jgi:hypothetical protein
MTAIANGGTLYCLQYPRSAQEVASFTPKIKRKLNIQEPIFGIIPGLRKAVEKGTARGARQEEPITARHWLFIPEVGDALIGSPAGGVRNPQNSAW